MRKSLGLTFPGEIFIWTAHLAECGISSAQAATAIVPASRARESRAPRRLYCRSRTRADPIANAAAAKVTSIQIKPKSLDGQGARTYTPPPDQATNQSQMVRAAA